MKLKRGNSILRKLREDKGFSQRELAEACGVNVNSVINWDYGTKPNTDNLKKLISVLDLTLHDVALIKRGGKTNVKDDSPERGTGGSV